MAKPDLVRAFITRDGSVLRDTGRGYSEYAVKGATSEDLMSLTVEETGANIISLDDISDKDNLKIVFDLESLPGISMAFRYVFRFNHDDRRVYRSGVPFRTDDKALLCQIWFYCS